jgi:hypothetical protein
VHTILDTLRPSPLRGLGSVTMVVSIQGRGEIP